jgi:hypothetical protein
MRDLAPLAAQIFAPEYFTGKILKANTLRIKKGPAQG